MRFRRYQRSPRSHPLVRPLLLLTLFLSLAASVATAEEPPDSALVRTPEPPRKSVGSRLLDIPEEVLRLPIRLTKGVVYGGIEAVYSSAAVANMVENAFSPAPITGLYPVGSYGSNSGLVGGLGYRNFDFLSQGDRLDLRGSYSTHHYQRYRIRYESTLPPYDRPGYTVTLQYRKRPWEYFYGLGNDSRQKDRVAYTLEQSVVEAVIRRPLGHALTARALGAFTSANTFDGLADHLVTDLDTIRASLGLDREDTRSTQYFSLGGGIEHDWRDNFGQPSHGGIERLTVTYHLGAGSSEDLRFFVTELEVQHFLNLFMKRILAVRLLARDIDRADDAPSLPFYLRNGLGGDDDLRGYSRSRFVDNDLALVSVEWRYPVWRVIDGFLFLDEARVFTSLRDDFSFRDWHSSYGLGLRVWSSRSLQAKAMLAFGEEEPRLYLDLGAEF